MVRVLKTGSKAAKARARKTSAPRGRKSAKTKRGIASSVTPHQAPSVADLQAQLEHRTTELDRALERQTATADILRVIASSPSDVQPVFEAIAESAARLCQAEFCNVFRFDGELIHFMHSYGYSREAIDALRRFYPMRPGRGSCAGRAILNGKVEQVPDVRADPEYAQGNVPDIMKISSIMAVPMVKERCPVGAIALVRAAKGNFPQRQIDLLKTFADQAVIAIENTRLFNEVQERTRDLSESLQQQTATADVLKVISRSAFDLEAVLNTLVESAVTLSGADIGTIFQKRDELFYLTAAYGHPAPGVMEYGHANPIAPGIGSNVGRTAMTGAVVQMPDVLADPDFTAHGYQRLGNFRAMLGIPLKREGRVEGVFSLTKRDPGLFEPRHVEVVQTFADQAVIAIENVRLFDEVQARTRELSKSLEDLRTAQDRLIQTEKLASLGQLTAGIAHEIKNPLNFVNNFSALSIELIDELSELLKQATLADKLRGEVDELTGLLNDNLGKVVQHGNRADSIVKNMLLHSREGFGERRSADINALVRESLNLAYHGARAEKAGFTITLQQDFDPEAGALDLYPQELTRALLNLISNGFYAATMRKVDADDGTFEPVLCAVTRNLGKTVEIRIRDNGTGIPPEVREKMFNPFFTTKPTGEGTGLGLSMTHDIIVKQHGGRIDVETEPGSFTEFIITLPRDNGTAAEQKSE